MLRPTRSGLSFNRELLSLVSCLGSRIVEQGPCESLQNRPLMQSSDETLGLWQWLPVWRAEDEREESISLGSSRSACWGLFTIAQEKNCSSYEWITWLGRPSLPQGADLSSVLDSVEHGLLFCELVWSSRGVLPHVSTHTRTVGFPFEIGSLAHTTNRPILDHWLMCDALLHSIRRCAVECGVRDRS